MDGSGIIQMVKENSNRGNVSSTDQFDFENSMNILSNSKMKWNIKENVRLVISVKKMHETAACLIQGILF